MKTINEIINDLVDFAVENDVLGNGKIDIKIGNLRIKKYIPIIGCEDVDLEDPLEEEVPTVEKVLKEAEKEEKKKFDFDKAFENYNTQIVASKFE